MLLGTINLLPDVRQRLLIGLWMIIHCFKLPSSRMSWFFCSPSFQKSRYISFSRYSHINRHFFSTSSLIRGMTMMSGLLDLTSLSALAGMSQLGSSCFMFIFIFCNCLWCMFVPLVGHFDVLLFTDNSSRCRRPPYHVIIYYITY